MMIMMILLLLLVRKISFTFDRLELLSVGFILRQEEIPSSNLVNEKGLLY